MVRGILEEVQDWREQRTLLGAMEKDKVRKREQVIQALLFYIQDHRQLTGLKIKKELSTDWIKHSIFLFDIRDTE